MLPDLLYTYNRHQRHLHKIFYLHYMVLGILLQHVEVEMKHKYTKVQRIELLKSKMGQCDQMGTYIYNREISLSRLYV